MKTLPAKTVMAGDQISVFWKNTVLNLKSYQCTDECVNTQTTYIFVCHTIPCPTDTCVLFPSAMTTSNPYCWMTTLCPFDCLWWRHYSELNLVCTHWWSYFHTISKYNHTCVFFLGIFFFQWKCESPLCPSHLILVNYVLYYCDLSIFTRISTYTSP